MTTSELDAAIDKSVGVFSDHVITEELYRHRMRKADLEKQIAEMKHIDESLEKMAKYKYRRFFAGSFVACSAYLGAGYHAIYNVEWLGWDIVEPLTYTVGQGSFILGLLWILRAKNKEEINKDSAHAEGEAPENCIWIPEYGLYDPMRKQVLTDEL